MKSLSPNKLASSSASASSSIQTSSDFELNSVFSGTIYEHVKAGSGPNNNGEFVTGSSSPSNFHFKLSGTDNNGATITAPTANGSIWISADGTTYSEIQLGSVSSESYGWRVNVADLDQRDIYLSLIAPSGYPIENGDTLYWANSNPAGTPVALADGDVVQYNAAESKFKPAQISSARSEVSGTTASIADGASADVTITNTGKAGQLLSIETSAAAWVTVYASQATRTADAARTETTDPTAGSGVLAEVITTGAQTVLLTPGATYFNVESTPTSDLYLKVVNKSGASAAITATLSVVPAQV